MLDFVEAEELIDHVDPVQYSIRLLVPPGSLLLDTRPCARIWARSSAATFSHRWTHPDPRMDALQAEIGGRGGARRRRRPTTAVTFDRVRAVADGAAGAPGAGARRPPGCRGPAAPAAPHRALVLLSGAHRGPVGPDDRKSPLVNIHGRGRLVCPDFCLPPAPP